MSEAQATWFATPEQQTQQQLESWRASTKVSRLQAKAALAYFGLLANTQAIIDDPNTDMLAKLAWVEASEFRRLSPMMLQIAGLLGLNEAELDELFEYALTVEV